MGAAEVEAFLAHLAVAKRVSASTQNQAKSAVLFLYRSPRGEPLPWLQGVESAKRPEGLPVVLTREEIEKILTHLSATVGLMICLLYGTGMRIHGLCAVRMKDVDCARGDRGPAGQGEGVPYG
jgi:integrase